MLGEAGGVEGEISSPLLRLRDEGRVRSVVQDEGLEACTRFKVLGAFSEVSTAGGVDQGGVEELGIFSLLQVRPLTGRTHQIRCHLASIGRPLVADRTYGGPKPGWCRRLFLHCHRLSLQDLAAASFEPEAPLPKDLVECLGRLRPLAGARAA